MRFGRTAARSVLRAAVAIVVALSACGGSDWPNDRVLTSPHFRYHARNGDVLCDDLLTRLEDNLAAVSQLLGFDPDAVSIDYYKYRDAADLRANGPCPGGWSACARGSTLHSSIQAHQHELIHGYVSHVGAPSNVYQEGLAEIFNCTAQAGPSPPGVSATAVATRAGAGADTDSIGDTDYYSAATFFVRYLIDQFGAQRFMQFYGTQSTHQSTIEVFRAEFETGFGLPLDDAWAQAFSPATAFGWPYLCLCAESTPSLEQIDFDESCGTGLPRTIPFLVDSTTTLVLTVAGAGSLLVVRSCDGLVASPALQMSTDDYIDPTRNRSGMALLTEVPAGKHYVEVMGGAGVINMKKGAPWLRSQCGDAEAIRMGTDIPSDYKLWLSSAAGAERWAGIETIEPFTQFSTDATRYCSACPGGAGLDSCLSPSSTTEIIPAGSYRTPIAASSGPRFHSVGLQFDPTP
jgi:hypothetical protein